MNTNEILKRKKIAMLIAMMCVLCCGNAFAQCPCATYIPESERLPAGFYAANSPEAIKLMGYQPASSPKSMFRSSTAADMTYGGVNIISTTLSYQGNTLYYVPPPTYSGATIINPYMAVAGITVNTPLNVVYSLYTYKATFPQDNKRVGRYDGTPSMQAIQECGTVTPITTQADIDNDLNKIYEFPAIKEDASGVRVLDWDGKTSGGVVVRDCVFIAAHDKDTGQLLGLSNGSTDVQGYRILARPGVQYTPGPTSVSAQITVAYDRPVRRIWAILAEANCTTGSEYVTFGVVNRGGEAIAAGMNQKQPGAALAVTELKNPTLDLDGLVKIFNWDNITGLDGKPVVPPDQNTQYLMIIDTEGDDGQGNVIPTVTGLNDGYLFADNSLMQVFPMPTNYTGIQNPAADAGKMIVETTPEGFVLNPGSGYNGEWEWTLTSVLGARMASGKGSFVSKSGLAQGIYFLTVSNAQGGIETRKVLVK